MCIFVLMTNTFKSILVLIFACITLFVSSKELVQFSGYVKDNESLAGIPYAAIYIKQQNKGTITNPDGFYNFVVAKGDTILIKSIGYKTYTVIIPFDIDGTSYSKDLLLEREAYELKGVTIRPLPEPNQLRQAVLNLDIPNVLTELAQQTIANSILNDNFDKNMKYDGAENYNYYAREQANYYYNRFGNQRPGISLTDPFAWAKFVKSIKDKKKKNK